MLKKIFFQIHWFLGITAGLILSIMGITGAIYSYEQQILRAINTDSYIVEAQNQNKLTPAELYQHFSKQDSELKINSISITTDPTTSSTVNIAKEGQRRGYNMLVNPYTAEVLPEIKGREFFQFIQRLHRYLTMGDFGKQLTGASALMLIFFVLSGLYLRWPKKHSTRQWLALKPKLKGRNFIWDLHAVVGTWVIVFYLMSAMTGLYWSYDWWRSGMFKVLGVEQPKPQMQQSAGNNPREGNARGRRDDQSKKGIDSVQISQALSATWAGFPQQLGQDYSSITLNIPKKADGKVEIVFLDAVVQHERAGNNATYDYQANKIAKLELYEDKKLNEKIMSSMLPVHRGSFFGPIYQFVVMLAALVMPLFFVTGWLLYLKRRKQKKLTLAARQGSLGTSIDPNADKWTILYASQTGTAEQIAYNTSTALQKAGVATAVKALKDTSAQEIAELSHVLFVVSTYGTGNAPDLATNFVKKNLTQTCDFSTLKYAVLALGSKEYPETYCTFGHDLNTWLKANHAQAIFNLVEVNNSQKTDLEHWYTALGKITHSNVEAIISEKTFDQWQLHHRQCLNVGSQGEPVFDLQIKPLHDVTWQAGDIAEVQAGNSLARIQSFIEKVNISESPELINALRYKNLSLNIPKYRDSDDLIEQLATLDAREYSIASIPEQGAVQLVVRQKQVGSDFGLGSGWLTQHAALNDSILMRIRSNPSFHLISDNRPLILIGNGTGIAGLMSLLQQREVLGFEQNWLIFGERQQSIDYFYQAQLEQWLDQQHLQHLDLAFSRDQEQRIYVQHKLLEQQTRLQQWVEQGAVIYICGSIEGMATGVEAALIQILGEEQLNQMRETERYRRDVY